MKANYRVKSYKCSIQPKLKALVRWKDDEGKWNRKYFGSLEEAKTFAQQREIELLNQGKEVLGFPSWLRIMAQECHAQLSKRGKTIRDATAHFVAFIDQSTASTPVEKAAADFYDTKTNRAKKLNSRYLSRIRSLLERFKKRFPKKLISDFKQEDMESFLATGNNGPVTYNANALFFREFFKWCIKRGYCSKNPAQDVRMEKAVETEIGILTVDQISKLLECADVAMLPYVAIGAFAGIRSEELKRLDWSEIDFEDGFIEVKAEKAKSARRRLVKIQPCLRAWIAPLAKPSGLIAEHWTEYQMRRLYRRAGIDVWPNNALRHSFASYHLARFKSAAELALEMGHNSTALIFQHYRQIVKESQALLYWNVLPADPENVLHFAQQNAVVLTRSQQNRENETGRFEGNKWRKTFSQPQSYYVEFYKRERKTIIKWMQLGMPLDDPQAMEDLRKGKYAHTAAQHAAMYGVKLDQIKVWRRSGWPLDDVDSVKKFLEFRTLRVRRAFRGPANSSFHIIPLSAKDAREEGAKLNRRSA